MASQVVCASIPIENAFYCFYRNLTEVAVMGFNARFVLQYLYIHHMRCDGKWCKNEFPATINHTFWPNIMQISSKLFHNLVIWQDNPNAYTVLVHSTVYHENVKMNLWTSMYWFYTRKENKLFCETYRGWMMSEEISHFSNWSACIVKQKNSLNTINNSIIKCRLSTPDIQELLLLAASS